MQHKHYTTFTLKCLKGNVKGYQQLTGLETDDVFGYGLSIGYPNAKSRK